MSDVKPNRTPICKRGEELTIEDIKAQCVETERGCSTGDACWEWMRARDRGGYGQVQFRGKWRGAHVVSYTLSKGAVPKGLCVLHRCDFPSCVRPDHLFLGTHADNTRDRISKGRHYYVCSEKNGLSKLTADQAVYVRTSPKSNADLARELGVSASAICDVRVGRSWKSAGGPIVKARSNQDEKHWGAKLTADQVSYVLSSPKSGNALAREFGVAKTTISRIRTGQRWKHVKPSAA